MGIVHRFFFGESALSKSEKETIIKLLSCVVWADSDFDHNEATIINEIVSELDGFPETSILPILTSVKSLTPELEKEIKALPEIQAHTILNFTYRIANADGKITEEELFVIRRISELILPGKDWKLVLDWIDANNTLIKTSRILFNE
ncbi:MAG: TerB family tellurite resistance protein [Spirochaetia bacterium]|nr:TerB family tellurite resistance protein [Spirochaetia bacterium]